MKRQLERYEQRKQVKKGRLEKTLHWLSWVAVSLYCKESFQVSTSKDMKEVATQTDSLGMVDACTNTHHGSVKHSATMPDMSGHCIEALEEGHLKTASKKSEFRSNEPWSENAFWSDEHKIKFYTGLPSSSILMIIYNFMSSQVRYGSKMHALST